MKNKKLDTAIFYLPGFIQELKDIDSQFGKIKPNMMKTTFPFNEYLRVALKNAIAKCKQSMSEKETDPDPAEAAEDELDVEADPSDDDEANEESGEAEEGEEEEEESNEQDAEPTANPKDTKKTKTPKVSPQSKRITKEENYAHVNSHLMKNP